MSVASDHATLLVGRLRTLDKTLAIAESCTGGEVAALLTAVPGASDCIWGAAVVYGAAAKAMLVGLAPDLIDRAGVVSAEVTAALAEGVRARSGADLGAAVTGWAGPTAAGPDPVGTVYLAVAGVEGVSCERRRFQGVRADVRSAAARALLEMLLACVQALERGSEQENE